MDFARIILRAALFAAAVLATAPARADGPACMSPAEARAAVLQGRALRFSAVKRSVESTIAGEILRARLCEIDGHLSYSLTVLKRDGQVVSVLVDAVSGTRGPAETGVRAPRIERRPVPAPKKEED